ncbi:MAG: zinc-dependent metalloprotease [Xanthomonadales bacterium]
MTRLRRILAPLILGLASVQAGADPGGLLDLDIDPDTGRVELAFETLPADYLYVTGLQTGAGSNDLGFDRGQLDRTRLVRFERFGNRVLLIEPNLAFRARTDDASERLAVEQAFAQSVLAGFEVVDSERPGVRIDLTPFLLSDAPRLAARIRELEQGEFSIDPERSAVDPSAVRNFPDNALLPAVITFAGKEPGAFIRDVTPTPDSLSIRLTHQFIRLPDDGYRPRAFHPRSGFFALAFRDYAAPLDREVEQRFIYRHRLAPGETLRYYVDPGVPEPVRSALLEGASWWREAFAEAGFANGFAVDVLPADADPLDARYNAIQWVHRATRGWSYGFSISDPRTGEIIKGHVSLGSLRVRQDQLIAEALTAPFTAPGDRSEAAQNMALARIRQLAAHEVGHTLGIDHNFAASFSGDASVMDYPHPNLYLGDDGRVRLDRAYARGVSPWDKLTIRYGYGVFPADREPAALDDILASARRQGIGFLGDQDARPPGSAHPDAHLWDNGGDVLARLDEVMAIRRIGLSNFSPAVIDFGTPLFEMERKLVPVFLLHRYQLEATAKLLGGLRYGYAVRGDRDTVLAPVSGEVQRRALTALLGLLAPEQLALPPSLRYLIPPPPLEHARDREFFGGTTGAPFDHLAPARAGAELVIRELLQPQRLARLHEQQSLDPGLPGPDTVIDGLLQATWLAKPERDTYLEAIRSETGWPVLSELMRLASTETESDAVRATALATLLRLERELDGAAHRRSHAATAARQKIRAFLENPAGGLPIQEQRVPPGSPIG